MVDDTAGIAEKNFAARKELKGISSPLAIETRLLPEVYTVSNPYRNFSFIYAAGETLRNGEWNTDRRARERRQKEARERRQKREVVATYATARPGGTGQRVEY